MSLEDRLTYWEAAAKEYQAEAQYYREELVKAHALLGRVVHQASERWDSVNITQFYPTDNLFGLRRTGNAAGIKK